MESVFLEFPRLIWGQGVSARTNDAANAIKIDLIHPRRTAVRAAWCFPSVV